ncbi:putative sensor with HAMP domain [Hyella patelloides LEGE 07179]|uniref:Putative sensor with HAMP domain n=1 Tax=Hyella patelloides LEGE 07179 TaxID=945734 RepID=A0A563VPS4_9CYAN|nr:putative sensor with HAMP domain [Hyella patelloides LEGE 07179]
MKGKKRVEELTPMFQNLKLGTKLNLILVLIFIATIASCNLILSYILEIKVEQEVAGKAFLAMETMNSVRNYTSTQIQPELLYRLEIDRAFLPETVPAYSAREVFEDLRRNADYQDFSYKEATLNPTSLRDKADEFEAAMIQKFRQNENVKELAGFRTVSNQNFYYVARPLAVNKSSCLQCHSTPEKAPQSLINTYGSQNGFNWQLNEIVTSQMVSVPANRVFATANSLRSTIMSIITLFFLLAIASINAFMRLAIVKPIQKMSLLSTGVSKGNLNTEFTHENNDEIGILAKALNRMKVSLQMALQMIEEEQNSQK